MDVPCGTPFQARPEHDEAHLLPLNNRLAQSIGFGSKRFQPYQHLSRNATSAKSSGTDPKSLQDP